MQDGFRVLARCFPQQFGRVDSLHNLAATTDEFIDVFGYDVFALNNAKRRARCELKRVERMRACVQSGFANRHLTFMDEPFAVSRDWTAVPQRRAAEVIGNHR